MLHSEVCWEVTMTNKPIEFHNEAGELHRLDGPAFISEDGNKYWRQNGLSHRVDGPAIEYADGSSAWYQNGLCHRLDGPAVKYSSSGHDWYINGTKVTEEVMQWLSEQNIKLPMSESELSMFILKFAGK
jgi:hypothetical protein